VPVDQDHGSGSLQKMIEYLKTAVYLVKRVELRIRKKLEMKE
jgi:hypothetical protein